MTETRPELHDVETGAELRDWYWLKAELTAFCADQGLSAVGSKAELTDRIAHFLDTGQRLKPKPRRRPAGFDWAKGSITPATVIDAAYSNGPNVRAFFVGEIGPRFRFTLTFMNWMKANTGRTMGDAAAEWLAQEAARKAGATQAIPASNQWNAYMRAFFDDNPGASLKDARAAWAAKRASRGHNRYEPGDLSALKSSDRTD